MVQFCPKCGTKAPDDQALFCNKCGNKLPVIIPEKKDIVCLNCGARVLDSNSVFCDKCGSQLGKISPERVQQDDERPIVTQPVIKRKKCPFCGTSIDNENRIYCPSCNSYLKGSQSMGTPQPEQSSLHIPLENRARCKTQAPLGQQEDSLVHRLGKKVRSLGEWTAICCGGVIVLILIVAVFNQGADYTSAAPSSDDKIYTQDLKSMAITINDLPTGWKTYGMGGTATNTKDAYGCKFIKEETSTLTVYTIYVDIIRNATLDKAKTEYNSRKAKITNVKVEPVSLGNEGFGYVTDDSAIVVFRQGNIIVRTQYGSGGLGRSSQSISDAKDYAKIVQGRIQ